MRQFWTEVLILGPYHYDTELIHKPSATPVYQLLIRSGGVAHFMPNAYQLRITLHMRTPIATYQPITYQYCIMSCITR